MWQLARLVPTKDIYEDCRGRYLWVEVRPPAMSQMTGRDGAILYGGDEVPVYWANVLGYFPADDRPSVVEARYVELLARFADDAPIITFDEWQSDETWASEKSAAETRRVRCLSSGTT